jgi:hypothetical protein
MSTDDQCQNLSGDSPPRPTHTDVTCAQFLDQLSSLITTSNCPSLVVGRGVQTYIMAHLVVCDILHACEFHVVVP